MSSRTDRWAQYFDDLQAFAGNAPALEPQGKLVRVAGLVLEATGVKVPVGSVCEIHMPSTAAAPRRGQRPVTAEVVGFSGDRAYLMPTDEIQGLASGAMVLPRPAALHGPVLGEERHPWRRDEDRGLHLPMGDGLLGRVVDPQGHPLDRGGPLVDVRDEPMVRRPINAMDRDPVAARWTPACARSIRC